MPEVGQDIAPAPVLPEAPVLPNSIDEEEATIGFVDEFFPRLEPAPKEQGVAPEFGSFRPVLGRPDFMDGAQALLEVMRAFDRDRPVPSNDLIAYSAELLSIVSFPRDEEGRVLTGKLIRAILRRELHAFGNEDRIRFAVAVGRREFPDDSRLAALQARWVFGLVEPDEDQELQLALARRGVGIHELVRGMVWVRDEAEGHFSDDVGFLDPTR